MNSIEIAALPAGRELNALIIKVLEFEIRSEDILGHWVYVGNDESASLFKPSENVRDAWHVVEKMQYDFSFEMRAEGNYFNPDFEVEAKFGGFTEVFTKAKTAPLAICRAALLAISEVRE